ncbi:nucleolar protein 16 [Gadus morhua]|uniref:Nucleolar protein 16 n=1 Tax=Gadus morhua TaxID=8049 RepID=A0A8C4Z3W1_GADMO|nr:nucleolar protein 16 [Gadus morhua]XP_059913607.1 nucleolar protein 16 isoform X1 [Gadus macrocephalus]XP_059913608.1 nucleolar protein 16 isoform X2 [Gadus macrocephalus]
MPKAKKNSHRKKYDYDKDRKKQKKQFMKKSRPRIEDKSIRHAWDNYKTSNKNLEDMGLAFDPNHSQPIRNPETGFAPTPAAPVVTKPYVLRKMEEEASQRFDDDKSLSRDLIDFVQHMVREHGEDYKAMARDEKNYYQDTPKQIQRKVNEYKRCHPKLFNAFIQSLAPNANPQSSSQPPVIVC